MSGIALVTPSADRTRTAQAKLRTRRTHRADLARPTKGEGRLWREAVPGTCSIGEMAQGPEGRPRRDQQSIEDSRERPPRLTAEQTASQETHEARRKSRPRRSSALSPRLCGCLANGSASARIRAGNPSVVPPKARRAPTSTGDAVRPGRAIAARPPPIGSCKPGKLR